jgi:hypothetical protein
MAIWFSQSLRSGEVRLIDYYEASGEGLPHYVQVLQERARSRGYTYGEHWAPPDINVREMGTGKTRKATAASLGLNFRVTPGIGLSDGIDATRLFLARCWFDAERCAPGLEALTQYRKKWNERLKQFEGTPEHDWASHGQTPSATWPFTTSRRSRRSGTTTSGGATAAGIAGCRGWRDARPNAHERLG